MTDDRWRDDVARIDDLVDAGMVRKTIRRRVKVGSWQAPVRGVVCRTTGELTARQRLRAALSYGGPAAALSHATAAGLWGLTIAARRTVVTVPHGAHPPSTADIHVRQSLRPFRALPLDGLRVTPPARSALDACLDLSRLTDVDALLGQCLQRRLATFDELADELAIAPSAGSRLPRLAMAELAEGSRSAAEAQLARLLHRAGIPEPELNAAVRTRSGVRYVDALWRALGKGVEVDGQAFHLGPEQWRADLARQNDIQTAGIVLLRISARRLWTEPDAVVREIRWFLGVPAAA